MKKTFLILGIMFLVVALSGCFKKSQQEHQQEQDQEKTSQQEQRMDGFGMSDLADMMSGGKKIKCIYRVKSGDDFGVTTYVDGKKYRTESMMNNVKYNSVFDGENMYSWMNGQKNGMKMNIECMKDFEMPEGVESQENMEIEENPVDMFDNKIDLNCMEVSKVDFSVPSDVEFTDQCEMMKNQMKMMQKNMPSL
ncbi:hypothetical protein ACFL08_05340 [Patescibacteria group bacterium]